MTYDSRISSATTTAGHVPASYHLHTGISHQPCFGDLSASSSMAISLLWHELRVRDFSVDACLLATSFFAKWFSLDGIPHHRERRYPRVRESTFRRKSRSDLLVVMLISRRTRLIVFNSIFSLSRWDHLRDDCWARTDATQFPQVPSMMTCWPLSIGSRPILLFLYRYVSIVLQHELMNRWCLPDG